MKTYLAAIIPRIQQFSQKLDNMTLLSNQHWVVVDEITNSKTVYIFLSDNELLISRNGKVEKAKWRYIGNNALLIDLKEESYLFRHGFFDENILALKVDGKEEYAFLVNESKYDKELNSYNRILEFLQRKYITPYNQSRLKSATGIEIESPIVIGEPVRVKSDQEIAEETRKSLDLKEQSLKDQIRFIKENIILTLVMMSFFGIGSIGLLFCGFIFSSAYFLFSFVFTFFAILSVLWYISDQGKRKKLQVELSSLIFERGQVKLSM